MSFHVGQKVVFVGGEFDAKSSPPQFKLTKGAVYTVREFDTRGIELCGHRWATVRLAEMVRPIDDTLLGPWETGYIADTFRPVIERKTETGMAILRKLLKTNKVDA